MQQESGQSNAPVVDTVLVIGLGLIGGSLAWALRHAGFARTVMGVSRQPATLKTALEMGVVDAVETDFAKAAEQADVIVLCTPLGAYETVFKRLKPHLKPDVILTDAGSVKGSVVKAAKAAFGALPQRLVPGHPIAGSERSGVAAANYKLYRDHAVLLTPHDNGCEAAYNVVSSMWEATGAYVQSLDIEHHDQVLAATSHLPHLIAFSLVDTLAGEPDNREIFEYAAGGFRDFTRIAASDPVMWHDILLQNAGAILTTLDHFSEGLSEFREAIKNRDSDFILKHFGRAKAARDYFSQVLDQRDQNKKRFASTSQSITRDEVMAGIESVCRQDKRVKQLTVNPCEKQLVGKIRVPGDKSISHRSIMLGALAEGTTRVSGFLEGEDSLATLKAFQAMGVSIKGQKDGEVVIEGVGLHGLKPSDEPLDLGNSGTSMRLMAGLLAGQRFVSTLIGDESLSKRPMARVAKPLSQMGATVETQEGGTPPMKVGPNEAGLKAIDYTMPMASAQVKSSLMLAGLYVSGTTWVEEPAPTRDHTERMLRGFGVEVLESEPTAGGFKRVGLEGGQTLKATDIDVPGDISSATFFMVAASIAPQADVTLCHVGINPTRIGVINILKAMGASIALENERVVGGEPVADIRVRSTQLSGIEIPQDQIPLAIDEFPALFVAAACAQGETVLKGAEELRVKESDRIEAMAQGLLTLGIELSTTPDGIVIQGRGAAGHAEPVFKGGVVESFGDHRIAMSFAIASVRANDTIVVKDSDNVATSFPNFVALANELGMEIS